MWLSLGLAVITGASGAMIADRLVGERMAGGDGSDSPSRFVWFTCNHGDIESDPAYPYPQGLRDRLLKHLDEQLDLEPEQLAEVRGILEGSREDARQYWTETRDDYCRMRHALRVAIRGVLRGDQVEAYDELLHRHDARWSRSRSETDDGGRKEGAQSRSPAR